MAKIRNFDSFEGLFTHFCPDEREIWHAGAELINSIVSHDKPPSTDRALLHQRRSCGLRDPSLQGTTLQI